MSSRGQSEAIGGGVIITYIIQFCMGYVSRFSDKSMYYVCTP